MKQSRWLLDIERRVLKGRPTAEVINQYAPANPRIGTRPFGQPGPAHHTTYQMRFRSKLSNDELNPMAERSWRKYDLVPKENRNNPDSFHFEQYRHGGKAYQQVFREDLLRLMEFPEKGALVVDVRSDFSQVKQQIPFSVRIPLEEVGYALQLDEAQFQSMYGFAPPEKGVEIICVSHDGVASEKALKEFERWGHPAECLYNFREGTNVLFKESLSDWGNETELVEGKTWEEGNYPLLRPNFISAVGPFNPKHYPYPSEDLDEELRRDTEGSWTVPKRAEDSYPLGKHVRKRRAYAQLVDGQWLRAKFVNDLKWYDHSHREPIFRWREPDTSHDKAYRPLAFRLNQSWKTVPH
eukprot:TRINITY_DN3430_c0_g1_i1.p1 TRINITY_DN3430_c0_g1~~TRINITY_DN3430_c0_g1_i1.p1  ORF type:complete len:353 (+),score=103.89 TRINITY_DN3430_c0_g1_i1:48-1106(+)